MKTLKNLKTTLLHTGCIGIFILVTLAFNCHMEDSTRLGGEINMEKVETKNSFSPAQIRKAQSMLSKIR